MALSPELTNGLFALGGAVVGAVIAGLFGVYAVRSSKEKKELVVSTSSPSRLLVVHDRIANEVEILVSGKKVESIIMSEIFLSNTGNKAVENLDFPVSCQPGCEIISIEALDQATNKSSSGSTITLANRQMFSASIDYINPGEELALRCVVSGESPNWTVQLRQSELKVIRRQMPVESYSDIASEIVLESLAALPFFRTYLKITSPIFKRFLEHRKID